MQSQQRPDCVYFGGPDRPPRLLRDILEERVEAVPPGGEIDWVTYYFRDRDLAEALNRAHRRGVRVRVAVDGQPRLAEANDSVGCLLSGSDGIDGGFRAVNPPRPAPGLGPRSRIHAKIYCFSHPQPAAFIGSFNPSGDKPEDPNVIFEIGNQDCGHNFLVEIADQTLVTALIRHVREVHSRGARRLWRWRAASNRVVEGDETQLYLYPRLNPWVIPGHISQLGAGDHLRIASSHIKSPSILQALRRSRERGADVSVITHDTKRRAPEQAVQRLSTAGVDVRRYNHHSGLPMHNKFMLLERGGRRCVYFGSLNLNVQSQIFNHEVLARSMSSDLFDAFAARWAELHAETAG